MKKHSVIHKITAWLLLGALLLACGQAIVLFATGRAQPGQRQHMPFGPALCAGSYLALLFGTPIVQWYLSFFPA